MDGKTEWVNATEEDTLTLEPELETRSQLPSTQASVAFQWHYDALAGAPDDGPEGPDEAPVGWIRVEFERDAADRPRVTTTKLKDQKDSAREATWRLRFALEDAEVSLRRDGQEVFSSRRPEYAGRVKVLPRKAKSSSHLNGRVPTEVDCYVYEGLGQLLRRARAGGHEVVLTPWAPPPGRTDAKTIAYRNETDRLGINETPMMAVVLRKGVRDGQDEMDDDVLAACQQMPGVGFQTTALDRYTVGGEVVGWYFWLQPAQRFANNGYVDVNPAKTGGHAPAFVAEPKAAAAPAFPALTEDAPPSDAMTPLSDVLILRAQLTASAPNWDVVIAILAKEPHWVRAIASEYPKHADGITLEQALRLAADDQGAIGNSNRSFAMQSLTSAVYNRGDYPELVMPDFRLACPPVMGIGGDTRIAILPPESRSGTADAWASLASSPRARALQMAVEFLVTEQTAPGQRPGDVQRVQRLLPFDTAWKYLATRDPADGKNFEFAPTFKATGSHLVLAKLSWVIDRAAGDTNLENVVFLRQPVYVDTPQAAAQAALANAAPAPPIEELGAYFLAAPANLLTSSRAEAERVAIEAQTATDRGVELESRTSWLRDAIGHNQAARRDPAAPEPLPREHLGLSFRTSWLPARGPREPDPKATFWICETNPPATQATDASMLVNAADVGITGTEALGGRVRRLGDLGGTRTSYLPTQHTDAVLIAKFEDGTQATLSLAAPGKARQQTAYDQFIRGQAIAELMHDTSIQREREQDGVPAFIPLTALWTDRQGNDARPLMLYAARQHVKQDSVTPWRENEEPEPSETVLTRWVIYDFTPGVNYRLYEGPLGEDIEGHVASFGGSAIPPLPISGEVPGGASEKMAPERHSFMSALVAFEAAAKGSYGPGTISVRCDGLDAAFPGLGDIAQSFEANGQSDAGALAGGLGLVALATGGLALLVEVPLLLVASIGAGAGASMFSLLDQAKQHEVNRLHVGLDILGLATSMLGGAMLGQASRQARLAAARQVLDDLQGRTVASFAASGLVRGVDLGLNGLALLGLGKDLYDSLLPMLADPNTKPLDVAKAIALAIVNTTFSFVGLYGAAHAGRSRPEAATRRETPTRKFPDTFAKGDVEDYFRIESTVQDLGFQRIVDEKYIANGKAVGTAQFVLKGTTLELPVAIKTGEFPSRVQLDGETVPMATLLFERALAKLQVQPGGLTHVRNKDVVNVASVLMVSRAAHQGGSAGPQTLPIVKNTLRHLEALGYQPVQSEVYGGTRIDIDDFIDKIYGFWGSEATSPQARTDIEAIEAAKAEGLTHVIFDFDVLTSLEYHPGKRQQAAAERAKNELRQIRETFREQGGTDEELDAMLDRPDFDDAVRSGRPDEVHDAIQTYRFEQMASDETLNGIMVQNNLHVFAHLDITIPPGFRAPRSITEFLRRIKKLKGIDGNAWATKEQLMELRLESYEQAVMFTECFEAFGPAFTGRHFLPTNVSKWGELRYGEWLTAIEATLARLTRVGSVGDRLPPAKVQAQTLFDTFRHTDMPFVTTATPDELEFLSRLARNWDQLPRFHTTGRADVPFNDPVPANVIDVIVEAQAGRIENFDDWCRFLRYTNRGDSSRTGTPGEWKGQNHLENHLYELTAVQYYLADPEVKSVDMGSDMAARALGGNIAMKSMDLGVDFETPRTFTRGEPGYEHQESNPHVDADVTQLVEITKLGNPWSHAVGKAKELTKFQRDMRRIDGVTVVTPKEATIVVVEPTAVEAIRRDEFTSQFMSKQQSYLDFVVFLELDGSVIKKFAWRQRTDGTYGWTKTYP